YIITTFSPYSSLFLFSFFFFNDPATTEIYTLSLHDALPISLPADERWRIMQEHIKVGREYPSVGLNTSYSFGLDDQEFVVERVRSEEHTSELQSPYDLVCRLLLEKKKKKKKTKKKKILKKNT